MEKESFPIHESSPEMKLPRAATGRSGKYPWALLKVGQSFFVGKDEIKRSTLQTLIYRQGQNLGRKFRIVEHQSGYEVGCVAARDNTGSFSTALDPRVAQRVEQPTGNAPLGWPVIKKEGE